MTAIPSQCYINNINNYNYIFPPNLIYIYGGITDGDIDDRAEEHVSDEEPYTCDDTWIIRKITTINITNTKYSILQYLELIKTVENYLIQFLDRNFKEQCQNDHNIGINNPIALRGGAGRNINNTKYGQSIKVYVYFKLNN